MLSSRSVLKRGRSEAVELDELAVLLLRMADGATAAQHAAVHLDHTRITLDAHVKTVVRGAKAVSETLLVALQTASVRCKRVLASDVDACTKTWQEYADEAQAHAKFLAATTACITSVDMRLLPIVPMHLELTRALHTVLTDELALTPAPRACMGQSTCLVASVLASLCDGYMFVESSDLQCVQVSVHGFGSRVYRRAFANGFCLKLSFADGRACEVFPWILVSWYDGSRDVHCDVSVRRCEHSGEYSAMYTLPVDLSMHAQLTYRVMLARTVVASGVIIEDALYVCAPTPSNPIQLTASICEQLKIRDRVPEARSIALSPDGSMRICIEFDGTATIQSSDCLWSQTCSCDPHGEYRFLQASFVSADAFYIVQEPVEFPINLREDHVHAEDEQYSSVLKYVAHGVDAARRFTLDCTIVTLPCSFGTATVATRADGMLAVTSTGCTREIALYSSTGVLLTTIVSPLLDQCGNVETLAFSPDGTRLLFAYTCTENVEIIGWYWGAYACMYSVQDIDDVCSVRLKSIINIPLNKTASTGFHLAFCQDSTTILLQMKTDPLNLYYSLTYGAHWEKHVVVPLSDISQMLKGIEEPSYMTRIGNSIYNATRKGVLIKIQNKF